MVDLTQNFQTLTKYWQVVCSSHTLTVQGGKKGLRKKVNSLLLFECTCSKVKLYTIYSYAI